MWAARSPRTGRPPRRDPRRAHDAREHGPSRPPPRPARAAAHFFGERGGGRSSAPSAPQGGRIARPNLVAPPRRRARPARPRPCTTQPRPVHGAGSPARPALAREAHTHRGRRTTLEMGRAFRGLPADDVNRTHDKTMLPVSRAASLTRACPVPRRPTRAIEHSPNSTPFSLFPRPRSLPARRASSASLTRAAPAAGPRGSPAPDPAPQSPDPRPRCPMTPPHWRPPRSRRRPRRPRPSRHSGAAWR